MNDYVAAGLNLTMLASPLIALRFGWEGYYRAKQRLRLAKRVRAWRRRMTAMADRPFHLQLLTSAERSRLIGRGGLTTEQWARAWAADFIAGRRDRQPTCGDYLKGFGRRPKVRRA